MDSVLGMLIFSAGGLAGATFLVPARWVKSWAYESWWMVYVTIGLVVCPPLICYFTVPDFWNVAMSAPGGVLARCAGFGAMWGVGALAWGLMVRYLGIGLGLAIGCGLCAATGTILPPIMNGQAASLLFDESGALVSGKVVVLAGVVGSLLGIVFVGLAGKAKENEMPEELKKKAVAEFDFKKGIATALVAGVFSSGMNLGLQGAGVIEEAAVKAGAQECWRGMPVIMVVLWGGYLVEMLWCMQQNFKNRTFADYATILRPFRPLRSGNGGTAPAEGSSGQALAATASGRLLDTPLRNVLLSALIGVLWVMQFVCTKAGEPLMGEVKYISFAVMMASTIFFSTLIGVMLGEWKGTGAKTKRLLVLGTLVLVVSFCVMSVGNK